MSRICDRIKSFICAVPFGMKAGDELLATSNQDSQDGAGVHQKVQQRNVYADLLRGEVTQEVEELRWEMYKAEELSNNYQYIGDGQAVKIDESDEKRRNRRLKFVQPNIMCDYGMKESLEMMSSSRESERMDFKARSIFTIAYDDPCVRFRLENHAEKVEVDLRKGIRTRFYIISDKAFRKHVPLVNAIRNAEADLKTLCGDDRKKIDSYVSRNEILSSMRELEFSTFNATNNVPNGIAYRFFNPRIEKIVVNSDHAMLEFSWERYEGGILLSEKYSSKTAEEKFRNKAPREGFALNVDFHGGQGQS